MDKTNNKLYVGTESGGLVKFYLDVSAAQRDVLLTSVGAVSSNLSLNNVQFRNYSVTSNQGNYIILSHKDFINATPNYINDYKVYRASANGGSYTPVVVDVTELYDQFAYGYDYHPLSVRNFLDYARNTWTQKPDYMFIIGKGLDYSVYSTYKQNQSTFPFALVVPTWGNPGSDNLFSSFNNSEYPTVATGRLSAWTNAEIGNYLTKQQNYEAAIKPATIPTVDHEYWKKQVLHIAGSSDVNEQTTFLTTLSDCENIIKDTLVGGVVTTIKKTSTDPVQNLADASIDSLMNHGVSYVSFYGHGSSAGFDYNLNNPG